MTKLVSYVDKYTSIETIFDEHWKEKYDFVYLSFVSTFDISISQYQLIPAFLQNSKHKDQKTLVIVFTHDSTNIKEQTDSILKKSSSDIDVWVISITISKQQIAELMHSITKQLFQKRIHPKQCMICNYYCFANPTGTEELFEKNMPLILQRCLNSYCDAIYADCLYQWFGYPKYTISLIYPYQKYKSHHLRNLAVVEKYCRQIPINGTINIHTFSVLILEIELANDKMTTQWFKEFCKYSLDITSDSLNKGLVPYHLDYQYKVRNQLV
jgi:hypothetical protein